LFIWTHLSSCGSEEPGARLKFSGDAASNLSEYRLLIHPWDKWIIKEPKILIVNSLHSGAKDLLHEQQKLALELLSDDRKEAKNPELVKLEQELKLLKTEIPTTATATGSKKVNRNYNRSYIDADGTIHINRNSGSYNGWEKVTKSTSQSLVKSTTNIVLNTSLDDLDQRIESLNKLVATWYSKISNMSQSGTSGVIWEADQAYLAKIKNFTKKLSVLKGKMSALNAIQESKRRDKMAVLKDWSEFEQHELPVLSVYFDKNLKGSFESHGNRCYFLPPVAKGNSLIIAFEVAQRTLYFDLTNPEGNYSPLRLIKLDSVDD
jgi:hypothetical protein